MIRTGSTYVLVVVCYFEKNYLLVRIISAENMALTKQRQVPTGNSSSYNFAAVSTSL